MKTINYNKKNLKLFVTSASNNRISVKILMENELYSKFQYLTVDLLSSCLKKCNYAFLNPDFPKDLKKMFKEEGLFGDTMQILCYDSKGYELVAFNLEKLKEYDSKGVKKFLKTNSYER